MLGFKIVTEKQVNFWRYIENDYDAKCNQVRLLKSEKEDAKKLLETLSSKLEGTGATVHAIKRNKEGVETFICVIDKRSPKENYKDGSIFLVGTVDMFVLNQKIHPENIKGKYIDMPYLYSEFHGTDVELLELHSDVHGGYYENHGYGTMLLETMIALAKKAGCKTIHGMLSDEDAKTEAAKEKRNGFYRSRGFTLKFDDAAEKNGHIVLEL